MTETKQHRIEQKRPKSVLPCPVHSKHQLLLDQSVTDLHGLVQLHPEVRVHHAIPSVVAIALVGVVIHSRVRSQQP